MDKKKTGRKPKHPDDKVLQKKVYLTNREEKKILKGTKQPDLTSVLKNLNH